MKCVAFVVCAVLVCVIALASGHSELTHFKRAIGCIKTAKANAVCKLKCSKQCKTFFAIMDSDARERRNLARYLCIEHTSLKICMQYSICVCANCIFNNQLCENSSSQACRDTSDEHKHEDCTYILTE